MQRSLLVLALVLVPSIAAAQDPPKPLERHGIFAGGALIGGNISCDGDNCGEVRKAGGGSGHIGWMFTPKLGVMLDLWAMSSEENNLTITYVTATANLRYWIAPIFWVQGGVGNGHASFHWDFGGIFQADSRTDDVPVVEIGVGVELVRGPHWALDLEAKLAQGTSTDENDSGATTGRMVGLGVGFTWFGAR